MDLRDSYSQMMKLIGKFTAIGGIFKFGPDENDSVCLKLPKLMPF